MGGSFHTSGGGGEGGHGRRNLQGDVRCSVLQCVAVCCSVLQCVAVCCSVWRGRRAPTMMCEGNCVVVCCNVAQCAEGGRARKT